MSVFFKKDLLDSFSRVKNSLKSCLSFKKSLFFEKDKILIKTAFQTILSLKFESEIDKMVYDNIIYHCVLSEKMAAGSFDMTLKKIVSEGCNSEFENESFHAAYVDVKNIIERNVDNQIIRSIIFDAIENAGFGGRISVEKSKNEASSIEVSNFYTFQLKTIQKSSLRITKPKFIAIDGYIDSVGEINRLLEDAATTKHQIILLAKGMSDDVLNTISVNNSRKTTFIYPALVNFSSIESVNLISDMCVVSGCLPISSQLGQLISNVSIDDATTLDECIIHQNSISIKKCSSVENVKNHINFLLEKRKTNEGAEEIYDTRIKSLSSNNVIIRLPDHKDYAINNELIDYSLRLIKNIVDYGVDSSGDSFSSHFFSNLFSKKCLDHLGSLHIIIKN